ncbi:MAG TPA: substrate-binding domain-containing protein [Streptosporangiaceae bacterium]|nr:substrate-binding domain-containing protein [Streptosporangiaceae bacterium]
MIAITGLSILLLWSLLANAMHLIDRHYRQSRVKHIAFLTPSSGGHSFYAAMLTEITRAASLALEQNYVIVPSVPTESFEAISVWALFSSLEDRQFEIDGIIFIPDQPDEHFDELVDFHERKGDIPLILLDVYFSLENYDHRTRARLPNFVGGNEEEGGRIAAEITIGAVGAPRKPAPVVVVLKGGAAPWEQGRVIAFQQRLRVAWPDAIFIESPFLTYSRRNAFNFIVQTIQRRAAHTKAIDIDAIFACTDDMAIGARMAITYLIKDGYIFVASPQIVGYDGISEIKEYIYADDPYIAGTVDAHIAEQAKAALLLMHKLLRSRQRRSEIQLITPHAIRRSGTH